MIVKCLNGDILHAEDEKEVASFFDVHPSQVQLIENDHTHYTHFTHYLIVQPHRVIVLPTFEHTHDRRFMCRVEWMMSCTNESILHQLLPRYAEFPPLFGNPNLADRIVEMVSLTPPPPVDCLRYMSANSSDRVLDVLFAKFAEHIDTLLMCENSNPRAVRYLIDTHQSRPDDTSIYWNQWFKHERDYVWAHVDHMTRQLLPPRADALELREAEFGDDPFTIARWAMCTNEENLYRRWIKLMDLGCVDFCAQIAIKDVDVVVDWLFDVVRVLRPKQWAMCTDWLSSNPHPRVVDYLLSHPEEIHLYAVSNPHPAMVQHSIVHYLSTVDEVLTRFYRVKQNPNPDVMIHCLELLQTANTTLESSQINTVYKYFSQHELYDIKY